MKSGDPMHMLGATKSPEEFLVLLCVIAAGFFVLIVINKLARAWGRRDGMDEDEFEELDDATAGLKKGIFVMLALGILFFIALVILDNALGAR